MISKSWRLGLGLFAVVILAIAGGFTWFSAALERQADGAWRGDLGRQAVGALALNAARTFPTEVVTLGALSSIIWSDKSSPCIFTTNQRIIEGNSSRVLFDDWPKGAVPTCEDFFSSRTREYDRQTTVPQGCAPVLTYPNRGGDVFSYLVLAADGAALEDLRAGRLSEQGMSRIIDLAYRPSNVLGDVPKFVRAGGLDHVSVKLDEMTSCAGFTLFRFSTDVANLDDARQELSARDYFVGIK